MSLTNTQLLDRIQQIERSMNDLTSALGNTASKKELKNILALLQKDVLDIKSQIESIEETGYANGLANHKVDLAAHSNVLQDYQKKVDFIASSAGITDAGKPIKTNSNGFLSLSFFDPPILFDSMEKLDETVLATSHTISNITVTVDYNLAGAIDPAAGVIFRSQADVDAYLAQFGATAFKHLQALWEALPKVILHSIVINLAAGIHRPRNPESNAQPWLLTGKSTQAAGIVTLQGASSVSYVTVVASQTITGTQNGSDNPWLDVSGTPYTAGALKGLFAVLSTGQVAMIHDNTTSRLFITANVNPTGPTSVIVCRPGTVLRNSYDNVTRAKTSAFQIGSISSVTPSETVRMLVNDIQYDAFNISVTGMTIINQSTAFTRCLWDAAYVKDTFAVTDSGRAVQSSTGNFPHFLSFTTCSFRGTNLATVPTTSSSDMIFSSSINSFFSFPQSFIGGYRRVFIQGGSRVTLSNTVIDKNWGYGLFLENGCTLTAQGIGGFTGVANTMRNMPVGVYLRRFSRTAAGATQSFDIHFEGMTGDCVQLEDTSHLLNNETTSGLKNVSGGIANTGGVGINLLGPFCSCKLNTGSNVSSSLGDVKVGGVTYTYADIVTAKTDGQNYIQKP